MMKHILIIIGSASTNSTNERLMSNFTRKTHSLFSFTVIANLKTLPHFNPELSIENTPQEIIDFRQKVEFADGIIICTPEYIFSLPSGLKNAIEWCVSTTVFSNKPIGLITASANGVKAHEELKLIMKTLMTAFTDDTTLLIQGVKGMVDLQGNIIDDKTKIEFDKFTNAFIMLMEHA